ncbi:hypothetical protein, partial [Nostoc sp. LPT]|uniref:hypothetical protein n=1 Tax=Nostoc sp. LPT TaxID=2815387 RepID=UPI0025EF3463
RWGGCGGVGCRGVGEELAPTTRIVKSPAIVGQPCCPLVSIQRTLPYTLKPLHPYTLTPLMNNHIGLLYI